jgi:3-deoxy-D-manno-octulosonic-acid transferase
MIRLYTLALRFGLIVLAPYFLLRSRRYWPTLTDRLGYLKLPQLENSIWIHAVSVGEVRAVEPLLERLRHDFPGRAIVLSTTTPTGQELARRHSGVVDATFYFPFDLPAPVRRTLDRLRPSLVIVAETEIWPNFLRQCRERRIPVMMINGRISDNSFPRYKRVRRWLGPVFANYAVLGMQSDIDRKRIEWMGANAGQVQVLGNLKFDGVPPQRPLDPELADVLGAWHPLWIAASTMPGEDEFVLDAFSLVRQSRPDLKLLIAPRHIERANEVMSLAVTRGLKTARRSLLHGNCDVMILDTIGELAATFEFASVVFVGGSLVAKGGHNILEPARFAKPIIFGPYMENFRDIARLFLDAKAVMQIPNPSGLAPMVECILANASIAKSLGENAHRVLLENTGATDRVMTFVRQTLQQQEVAVEG